MKTRLNEKLNNFKDYGFEADFEGEIFKEVDDYLYGIVKCFIGKFVPVMWDSKTGNQCEVWTPNTYNLTPLKKEWYEDSNISNKIIYVTSTLFSGLAIFDAYLDNKIYVKFIGGAARDYSCELHECRPATKEEVMSLCYEE